MVPELFAWFYHFFFNDTATTEIYTLSLHDALPISADSQQHGEHRADLRGHGLLAAPGPSPGLRHQREGVPAGGAGLLAAPGGRSEEHTSELQSRRDLVCRLLLEKKKQDTDYGEVLR